MPRRKSESSPRSTEGRRNDIRMVAARAGVSIASVSRTINRVPTVDPKIAKRVWAAVKELGYQPNTQARALVSGRSRLFGLIISDITNPFFPELIQNFEDIAVKSGYEVLIGSTSHDPMLMERVIDRMLQRSVEGAAVMTFGIEETVLDRLAARGVPLVFMDIAPDAKGMSTLSVDYAMGIGQAVQHLAVLGHRRIGFIAGPAGLHSAILREKAFRSAMADIGMPPPNEYIVRGDHTLEGGTEAMGTLLKLQSPPTAVMCSNDMTAIGVLHAAADAGIKVPEQMSVIGFDDIHIARYMIPPLTTIQMSCRDLAQTAFHALCAYVEGDRKTWRRDYPISTRLSVRRSTSIPHGALSDLAHRAAPPAIEKKRAARTKR
jgi:DNA-binding LacI/PurR family transcriptional regulator